MSNYDTEKNDHKKTVDMLFDTDINSKLDKDHHQKLAEKSKRLHDQVMILYICYHKYISIYIFNSL